MRQPLSARVAHRLTEFIDARNLGPGDVLPSEHRLAEEFGVSRPVVREALKTLAGQGMVEIVNGKGALVRPLDASALSVFFGRAMRIQRDAVIGIMEVRRPLEAQSARLAAERRTPEDLVRMVGTVSAMREHLEDPEGYADLDVRFHLLLAEATRNRMMYYLVGSIRESLRDAVLEGLRHRHSFRQLERVQQLHEEILAEVERRNPVGAGRAMTAHFDDAVMALVNEGVGEE